MKSRFQKNAALAGWLLCAAALAAGCREGPKQEAGRVSATGPADERTGRVEGAPTSTGLVPFAVGQWVSYTIAYTDGRRGELTYKIVGRDKDALWAEVVTGTPNAGTVLQLLIVVGDRQRPEATRIEAARISMPNGAVRELRGVMLDPSRPGYQKALSPLFVAPMAGAAQEGLVVPAGKFEGCYRFERPLAFGELDGPSKVWIHPSVPLTGLVRAAPNSGEATIELRAYAMQGAQTSMKRQR